MNTEHAIDISVSFVYPMIRYLAMAWCYMDAVP